MVKVKVSAEVKLVCNALYAVTQDLVYARHALGISPSEQEVIDMQNEVERKGRIFFPDFCKLSLRSHILLLYRCFFQINFPYVELAFDLKEVPGVR